MSGLEENERFRNARINAAFEREEKYKTFDRFVDLALDGAGVTLDQAIRGFVEEYPDGNPRQPDPGPEAA